MSRYNDLLQAINDVLIETGDSDNSALRDKMIERISRSRSTSNGYDDSYFEEHATKYIDFTYENPTIFHVVKHFSKKLDTAGFTYLSEKDNWDNITPGKYYTSRNGACLVAFVVGKNWTAEKGVGAIGSHIDSLTVSLKPNSTKASVEGYELLGVAPYAGTLGPLWWDRDLGLGGRVLVRENDKVVSKLVDSTPHPIAKIPSLAPHFGSPAEGPFNKETQAIPVVGFNNSNDEDVKPSEQEKKAPLFEKHSLQLLRYISSQTGAAVENIVGWDLQLYDVQKGTHGGFNKEFVFAPRVDDRICSYAALSALIEAEAAGKIPSDNFSIVGLFDNEEIGSGTRQGIKGQLLESVVSRVAGSQYYNEKRVDINQKLKVAYANTIILSADVNHLYNPNFDRVYLEHHKPIPNKGVTISLDPNGHMATDSVGLALAEELARINGDKLQYFQIRNDSRSGGTIGPFISSQTGARTIDLGIPQLSMHSIRATVGAKDIGLGVKFFAGFFENWRKTYDSFGDL